MSKDFDYSIRFCEHMPSGTWNERKYRIAEFVAHCWISRDPNEAWTEFIEEYDDRLQAGNRLIDDKTCYEYNEENNCFILYTSEDWSGDGCGLETVKHGMQQRFPDIDYECHMGMASDDPYCEEILIVKNGVEYDGSYSTLYLIDYLEEWASGELLNKINEAVKAELSPKDFKTIEEEHSWLEPSEYWKYYLCEYDSSPLIEKIRKELLVKDKDFDMTVTEANPYPIPKCVLIEKYGNGCFPTIPAWFSF